MSARPAPRRRQRGQAMTEYIVIAAGLIAALFFVDVNGKTMAQFLVDMIRLFFTNLTYFISLP